MLYLSMLIKAFFNTLVMTCHQTKFQAYILLCILGSMLAKQCKFYKLMGCNIPLWALELLLYKNLQHITNIYAQWSQCLVAERCGI